MLRTRGLCALVFALLMLGVATACGVPRPADAPQPGDRLITHAKGETRVGAAPERVVVLGTGELDAALALGIKPVGMVVPDAAPSLPKYLADKVRDVPVVGTIGSPNLEKIATLQPDLILSSTVRNEDQYEELNAIAPTVFSETVGKPWKENFLLHAQALGREAQAQNLLDRYHAKATSLGERIGNPAATQVSAVRFTAGTIRLYGKGSFIGSVLDDIGFSRVENQRLDRTFSEISREKVSEAGGDLLFYGGYGQSGKAYQNEITHSAQWTNLNAVRTGQAHEVPDDLWYLGLGPIAADLVLDDLGKHVMPH